MGCRRLVNGWPRSGGSCRLRLGMECLAVKKVNPSLLNMRILLIEPFVLERRGLERSKGHLGSSGTCYSGMKMDRNTWAVYKEMIYSSTVISV